MVGQAASRTETFQQNVPHEPKRKLSLIVGVRLKTTPEEETMLKSVPRWILTGAVAAALMGGTSARSLVAQNAPEPDEPRPGSRADRIEDKREAQALRSAIFQDRERLRVDRRRFGPHSPVVMADRARLRRDQAALRRLRVDRRLDRRMRRQSDWRG